MKKGRLSKYDPTYCELVIQYMSKGFSKDVVAAKLGISRDTLYEWAKKHDDFSDTIKRGEVKSLYFWEKTGIDGMMGKIKGFNAIMWIFIMKNRFRYRDEIGAIKEEEVKKERYAVTPESLSDIARKYGKEFEILDRIETNSTLAS